jgi:hypothetical protein
MYSNGELIKWYFQSVNGYGLSKMVADRAYDKPMGTKHPLY